MSQLAQRPDAAPVPALADGAPLPAHRDRPLYFAVKRCIDVLGSSALLVLLSPLLFLVALAIKLDSRGPVLFAQERAASRRRVQRGQAAWELGTFRIYKFRTMVHDAGSDIHEAHVRAFVDGSIDGTNGNGAAFKLRGDPRVTRVGKLLRKLSIDELPQLVNVLAGDMSLVGPRPVPLYEAVLYRGAARERFDAPPGITGLWQVSGRCDVSFEEMIRLDVEYVRSQSLRLDLAILLRTLPAVFFMRGAG